MATYIFSGENETVFPSLGVTVNYGDTFEAPDGLIAEGVAVSTKSTKSKADPIVDPAPAESTPDAGA